MQLIDGDSEKTVWGEQYHEAAEHIFDRQGSIVHLAVSTLSKRITEDQLCRGELIDQKALKAWDLCSRGEDLGKSWKPDDDRQALEYFLRAIELDPTYARAHACAAFIYNSRNLISPGNPTNDVDLEKGGLYAREAVRLDNLDSRNHVCLGWWYLLNCQFDRGEHHFERAGELNPHDASTLIARAQAYAYLGRGEEATNLGLQALALVPYHPPEYYYVYLSTVYFAVREYERTLEAVDAARALLPEVNAWKIAAHVYLGQTRNAEGAAQEFMAQVRSRWAGLSSPGPQQMIDWLDKVLMFREFNRPRTSLRAPQPSGAAMAQRLSACLALETEFLHHSPMKSTQRICGRVASVISGSLTEQAIVERLNTGDPVETLMALRELERWGLVNRVKRGADTEVSWSDMRTAATAPKLLALLDGRVDSIAWLHPEPDCPVYVATALPVKSEPDPASAPAYSLGVLAAGRGSSLGAAIMGALAEASEVISATHRGDEVTKRLTLEHAGERAILPSDLLLISEVQYRGREHWNGRHQGKNKIPPPADLSAPIDWVEAQALHDGTTWRVPAAYCYLQYRWRATEPHFCQADTNGCAVAASRNCAIFNALLELLERDAASIWWYNCLRRPAVDLDALEDKTVQAVRLWLGRSGARYTYWTSALTCRVS